MPISLGFLEWGCPNVQPRPQLFPQKMGGATRFLREKPWGRGCQTWPSPFIFPFCLPTPLFEYLSL